MTIAVDLGRKATKQTNGLTDKIIFCYREGTKTISWLSEETSQRYSKMFGLKPVLSLGTKDGAFFSPDDIATHILADNDKVSSYKYS